VTNLVASYTPGVERNDFGEYAGMQFKPSVAMLVSQLGCRMATGNTSMTVVLTDVTGATILASAVVSFLGGTVGNFYYAPISPITLASGTAYCLFAEVSIGGPMWADSGPVTLNNATAVAAAAEDNLGGTFLQNPNESYVGVDLVIGSTGNLTGTAVATSTATGILSGKGALTGTATATSTAGGALAGRGALAGTSTATSTATGALTGRGAIAGTATGASAAAGILTGRGALSGTAVAGSSATGVLTGSTGTRPPVIPAPVSPMLRVLSVSDMVRVVAVSSVARVVEAPVMSTVTPIRLPSMIQGSNDTRGIDTFPSLRIEGDTVVSITGITVTRRDGTATGDNDLKITPQGFAAPWIAASPNPNANSALTVVNWWQGAGASIAAAGAVDYELQVSFLTTAGRPLIYTAYQLVSPTLG